MTAGDALAVAAVVGPGIRVGRGRPLRCCRFCWNWLLICSRREADMVPGSYNAPTSASMLVTGSSTVNHRAWLRNKSAG